MDEYHTFVDTLIALIVKCGNLWGGPFFELQMACFNKESSHKLVSRETLFFYNLYIIVFFKAIFLYLLLFLPLCFSFSLDVWLGCHQVSAAETDT